MLFRIVVTVVSIKVDYLVYILTHLPLISYCFRSAPNAEASVYTERVNAHSVYQTRRHAVSTTGAVIIYWRYLENGTTCI